MQWDPNLVRTELSKAGFTEDTDRFMAGMMMSFVGPVVGGWQMVANAGLTNGSVDEVTFGIYQVGTSGKSRKGTQHRARTHGALVANLQRIVAALGALAANDTQMKCPECKTRWVHMKEPNVMSPRKFRPFLSCDGMEIIRGSPSKNTNCRGTSNTIPALVVYD